MFLVEGPSDVLAATAAGLAAVGRPSNRGGVADLAALLADLPAGRPVVVVGENDRKAEGSWPGRDGAEAVAGTLSARLGRVVVWALPPDGAKDARAWLTDPARGETPWPDRGRVFAALLGPADGTPAAPAAPPPPPPADWPHPLAPEALYGLAGDFVAAIAPHTEADPVALLVSFLVAAGNAVGRTAHAVADGSRHYPNEYAVLVGQSSKARKGTSWGRVAEVLEPAAGDWFGRRVMSGMSSGEGLIYQVRDPAESDDEVTDPGEPDKRLLLVESEFATVLKQTERQGNTLSAVVRDAWDKSRLSPLTKNNRIVATGAHVSIIGHITREELHRYLTATESANGFANRFLWFLVRRSQLLPFGGRPDARQLATLSDRFRGVLAFAGAAGETGFDGGARGLWADAYPTLSRDRYGLAGSLTGRAEAHVLRLALLYALLDRSPAIRVDHLAAGIAVWEYAEESVGCVFGDSTGNPLADELLRLIRSAPGVVTRTDLQTFLGRNVPANRIGQALGVLLQTGLARHETRATGGRPAEVWFAVGKGVGRGG